VSRLAKRPRSGPALTPRPSPQTSPTGWPGTKHRTLHTVYSCVGSRRGWHLAALGPRVLFPVSASVNRIESQARGISSSASRHGIVERAAAFGGLIIAQASSSSSVCPRRLPGRSCTRRARRLTCKETGSLPYRATAATRRGPDHPVQAGTVRRCVGGRWPGERAAASLHAAPRPRSDLSDDTGTWVRRLASRQHPCPHSYEMATEVHSIRSPKRPAQPPER
jgi:hypothetical protein